MISHWASGLHMLFLAVQTLPSGISHPLKMSSLFVFNFFNYFFFLRERGGERESKRAWEGQKEREGENPKQASCYQRTAWCGAHSYQLWDHDLSRHLIDRATRVPPKCPFHWLFHFSQGEFQRHPRLARDYPQWVLSACFLAPSQLLQNPPLIHII